jgi:hypothetical protein
MVVEDLMGEAKRVAALCEADFSIAVDAAAAADALHAATATLPQSGGNGGSATAQADCECIGIGGMLVKVQVLPSPSSRSAAPLRVPVKHSPSRYSFPPLAVDCVDVVFAKCRRLAHLRTSLFGVYDGHLGLEAAEVRLLHYPFGRIAVSFSTGCGA